MKEGIVISASWKLLKGSMLATLPILGVEDPRAFYKKAWAIYRREMESLTEYGEGDVLKLNLAQAVMLGAIYEACDPKPDIDTLTRFYHEFLTRPAVLRKMMGRRDMLAPREVQRQVDIGKRSQRATHPYTWQFSVEVEDADRFTATFTRCGIYDYLRSRGMAHIVPAMCAIDYTMGEISNHLFLRNSTLATGGAVCDCHYVRKSAATQEEWAKSQEDKRQEALRGGRTIES
ncbi:MAG: L-2-amino-thiazoline-4-carboxylic acid hydrolase [Atopobiaceae bacterium]|nr:L-2-amino-thiazoline-4-carboxylic acid hydrolase [Atopobiaceae bacterium]